MIGFKQNKYNKTKKQRPENKTNNTFKTKLIVVEEIRDKYN